MTYTEFLAQLKLTPRTWKLRSRALRTADSNCPITAVAAMSEPYTVKGGSWDACDWVVAYKRLGMTTELAKRIVYSADDNVDKEPYDSAVRKELLSCCDL